MPGLLSILPFPRRSAAARNLPALALVFALLAFHPGLSSAKNKHSERDAENPAEKFQQVKPVSLDRAGEKWAAQTLHQMSLEEKVGQMLMVWAEAEFLNVRSPAYERLRNLIRLYHLGGFGLTVPEHSGLAARTEPFEAAALINELQRESKIPLLIGADFERGVAMRISGSTAFPQAMAFGAAGDPEYAAEFGRITAQEARAIGVQWNWFPVTDVNSNPANPIINTRAFSGDPAQVGALAAAYIRAAREAGLLTTAKHFPGHGDASADSHLDLVRIEGNEAGLRAQELPPFQAAIDAGVDAVMVGHISVPALDPDPAHVATNSEHIIQDILRKQLGFSGIVISDALDMNGFMRLYGGGGPEATARATVAAVKAGNDIALLPPDVDAAFNGLARAVRSGEISREQIDAAVLRILRAKASVGLHRARLVDLEALPRLVHSPENQAVAQRISDAAVALVRQEGAALPLRAQLRGTNDNSNAYTRVMEIHNRLVAVVFTDDVRSDLGRGFERELRMRAPDANVIFLDENIAAFSSDAVAATVAQAEQVIAVVDSAPVAGRVNHRGGNSLSLAPRQSALLQTILDTAGDRAIVVALGNPYVAGEFPAVRTYLCTFSNAPVSEISAVKALFGEIAIGGKLPVSIPGYAQRGEGLSKPQSASPPVVAAQ